MDLSKGRTGIAAAIMFLMGPLVAHFAITRPIIGFVLFAAGGLCALFALIMGIVASVRHGFQEGSVNVTLGAILTGLFLMTALSGRGHPRINDITTDMVNPPSFVAIAALPENQGRDLSYPGESFATQQKGGYPDLTGLSLAGSREEILARAQAVAATMPSWKIVQVDASRHAIEGISTSRLFQFKDDFVIEVRDSPNGGSRVEMRSKSRVGKGDIGANAARIEAFFAKLRDSHA